MFSTAESLTPWNDPSRLIFDTLEWSQQVNLWDLGMLTTAESLTPLNAPNSWIFDTLECCQPLNTQHFGQNAVKSLNPLYLSKTDPSTPCIWDGLCTTLLRITDKDNYTESRYAAIFSFVKHENIAAELTVSLPNIYATGCAVTTVQTDGYSNVLHLSKKTTVQTFHQ